jgi:hypothetical protein
MSVKSWTGFVDMIVNLKDVISALRAQDKAMENQLIAASQEIALQQQEIRHLRDLIERLERRTDNSKVLEVVQEIKPRLQNARRKGASESDA